MRRLLPAVVTAAILALSGLVNPAAADGCKLGSLLQQVASALGEVAQMDNGGIFSPSRMWAAVVDRDGVLCGVVKTGDAWPGSRAIAIAKAETANDFSNSALSLSTAMLYAPSQPGGSLYGLNNSNPFNPFFNEVTTKSGPRTGVGDTPGGIITFGGGLALYSNGQVVGGLGLSGDSSCADHAIAYRIRRLLELDAIPTSIMSSDNIQYAPANTPPTGFQQPHCFPSDLDPSKI